MEVARPFFRTPQPHHLAELRIEAAQSTVAFSEPCASGRKRRCLLPAFSPRKKMLIELPPFSSVPAPAPSPGGTGCTANVFSPALARTGGSGGGSFAFSASPEQPLTPAGYNSRGAFAFLASPERPLTPVLSPASGDFGFLVASKPSFSPSPRASHGTGAFEFLASPKPARTGSNDSGGFAFFTSPKPQRTGSTGIDGFPFLASHNTTVRRTGHPLSAATKELPPAGSGVSGGGLVSPPFVFSASRTSALASPVRKSAGSNLWSRRRRRQRQSDEQLQITLSPRKVAKTEALATGESSRCAAPSVSTAKPCCTLLTSPAKASKQEAKNDILSASDASRSSSPHRSPAGTCCTFVTSATRQSVEKASKREREVQVSSVAGVGPTSPAACPGAEVVVRVTCSCGARKEFCFDHCY